MNIFGFLAAGYNFLLFVLFITGFVPLALGWTPKLGKLFMFILVISFYLTISAVFWIYHHDFQKIAIHNLLPQMPMEDCDVPISL